MSRFSIIIILILCIIFLTTPVLAQEEGDNFELNTFYAHHSFPQFEKFYHDGTIEKIDYISFGWSRLIYDESMEKIRLTMLREEGNDFYVPQGFDKVIDTAKNKNISLQLNIYADNNYNYIFNNSTDIIKQILAAINGSLIEGKYLSFDGVVIDFENLPLEYKEFFNIFLQNLNTELKKSDKKLFVAVQPRNSYDFSTINKIADRVILMLHDYDAKKIITPFWQESFVKTPLTPINKVRNDLQWIVDSLELDSDLQKIWLQINFAASQWKTQEGKLIKDTPYTPNYEMIYNRIILELQKGVNLVDLLKYDEQAHNPYIIFTDQGEENIIWYEDSRSVQEKITLAREYGLGGISLWRMGNIPDRHTTIHLNAWQKILDNL